jgi:Fe-S-cluster containining protein
MRLDGFNCKRCGTCCSLLGIEYELYVDQADVRRWERQGRDDILAWVAPVVYGDREYDFPVDPGTGDEVVGDCPFLERDPLRGTTRCLIHDTRPRDCAVFPAKREDAACIGCLGYG